MVSNILILTFVVSIEEDKRSWKSCTSLPAVWCVFNFFV